MKPVRSFLETAVITCIGPITANAARDLGLTERLSRPGRRARGPGGVRARRDALGLLKELVDEGTRHRLEDPVIGIAHPLEARKRAPKLFFGYATGTNLMFPFRVGAKADLTVIDLGALEDQAEVERAKRRRRRSTAHPTEPESPTGPGQT